MNRSAPLSVLVGSTLLGVALGAVVGAELHIDVVVPERIVTAEITYASSAGAAPAQAASGDSERRGEHRRSRRSRTVVDSDLLTEIPEQDWGSMGRALLHRGTDGEFDGYRISAIREGSVPDRLGLANGDIVHSVDERPLTSLRAVMAAYEDLQGAERFSVELTRRGKEMTKTYEVR